MSNGKSLLTAVAFLSINLFYYSAFAQESGDAGEHVPRAVFTSGIQNREPTDTVTTLSNDKDKIYFFSELRGLGGKIITHRWEYQGRVMSEIKFDVGGPRWRVWSSKTLLPQWTGEWRVSIIDSEGNVLETASFDYTASESANQGK